MTERELAFDNMVGDIESQLQEAFPQFRRIWLQYSRPSKKREEYNIIITLFPLRGDYTMLFSNLERNITFEITSKIIQNYLDN